MCSAQLGGCFLAPRTVWLACVGRLAFLVCVCAFDGFLLWVRIASACPTIASLCNACHQALRGVCGGLFLLQIGGLFLVLAEERLRRVQ